MTVPHAFIVHCPAMGRSLAHVQAHIPHAQVVETPRTPHSHDGAIAGHQAAVRMAKEHGWSEVMVFEDDCLFTDAWSMDKWLADLQWARTHGYTMLNGGVWSCRNPRQVREGLFAVDHFKSCHCMVYLPEAYPVVEQLVFPMDVMMGRLGARTVVTYPFMVVQCPMYSGIQCKPVDYVPGYARNQARLASLVTVAA